MTRTGDCKKFYELFLKKVTGEKISLEDFNFMDKHASSDDDGNTSGNSCMNLLGDMEKYSYVCEDIDLSLDLAMKIASDRPRCFPSNDELARLAIAIFEGIGRSIR